MITVIRKWREDGLSPDTLKVAHKRNDESEGFKFKRLAKCVTAIPSEGIGYPPCTSKRLLECK